MKEGWNLELGSLHVRPWDAAQSEDLTKLPTLITALGDRLNPGLRCNRQPHVN